MTAYRSVSAEPAQFRKRIVSRLLRNALFAGTALGSLLLAQSPVAMAADGDGGRASPVFPPGGIGGAGQSGFSGSNGGDGTDKIYGGGGGGGGASGTTAGGAGGTGGKVAFGPSTGGNTVNGAGGSGGSGAGQAGTNGTSDTTSGGGGGGGGGGGTAGNGATGNISGPGPYTGGNGGDGGFGSSLNQEGGGGGGGGGGGYGAIISATGMTNTFTLTGGNGGDGGAGGSAVASGTGIIAGGNGGNGGAGGFGVQILSPASSFINFNGKSITGGNGGKGGDGGNATMPGGQPYGANGGNGGTGGTGIAASSVTITNGGNITGGNGGAGGAAGIASSGTTNTNGAAGAGGNGGAGIAGSDLTIINSGMISGGVANNGAGAQANAITFSSGTNALTTNGGTYVGNIDISAGTLTLSQTTISGATGSTTYTTSAITGGGAVAISTDAGKSVTLGGTNTYSGQTTVNDGSNLVLDSATAIGSNTLNLLAGSSLKLNGIAVTNAVTLTGGSTFIVNGASSIPGPSGASDVVVLGTTNAATDVLTITSASSYVGTTQVGDGITGITLKAGIFGAFKPDSAFTVNTNGILDLNGINQTIASLTGGGKVTSGIAGMATLTTGDVNSTTFSGVIQDGSGTLSLNKTGSGVFALSGNNTYSGATTISDGTLEVTGLIANSSSIQVASGGTLSGTGTIGSAASTTTIASGGTLSPGNSTSPTGALSISGNLAFQSGAIYLIQVSPSAASRTNINGTAALAGTVNAQFASGSYVTSKVNILSASSVSGTFSGLTTGNLPAGFQATLDYSTPGNVYLDLVAALNLSGLNQNQRNVAGVLNTYFNNGGALPPNFVSLFALTGSQFTRALTQVSGETATGSQQATFDAMSQFMGLMTDPFTAGRGDPSAGAVPFANQTLSYASPRKPNDALAAIYRKAPPLASPFQERWNVWAAGFGGSRNTDSNTVVGSNNTTSRVYAGAVGADYWFSPYTVAGFSLAGGGTNFSVANGGSGRSDLFQAGAFVRQNVGSAYITAAAAYGWQDITTERFVTVGGLSQLRAQFNANAYSGRIEGGNRFVMSWMGGFGLTPYAAAQVIAFDLPSYAESTVASANTFALAYAGKTVTATRSELGIRTDKSFAVNDAILTLRGRAAWAHDYGDNRIVNAGFLALPGTAFTVNGAAPDKDTLLVSAGAELAFRNGVSIAGSFEGEVSGNTQSYAGKGALRYRW